MINCSLSGCPVLGPGYKCKQISTEFAGYFGRFPSFRGVRTPPTVGIRQYGGNSDGNIVRKYPSNTVLYPKIARTFLTYLNVVCIRPIGRKENDSIEVSSGMTAGSVAVGFD